MAPDKLTTLNIYRHITVAIKTDDYGTDIPPLMAASLLAMLPLVIIFVFFQKYLVRGIQLGAVKG